MWTRKRIKARLPVRRPGPPPETANDDDIAFSGLHWAAAGLFLAMSAEAAAHQRLDGLDGTRRSAWNAAGRAPVVVGPLAGAAHAVRAIRPERRARVAIRILDALAIAAAVAAMGAGAYTALADREQASRRWGRRRARRVIAHEVVAPLAFGATATLGLLLDREEQAERAARRRLESKASLVERLVPRRRPKLDRIVLHV